MERPSVQKVMLSLVLLEEEMNRLEKENRELSNENIRLSNVIERLEVQLSKHGEIPKAMSRGDYDEYLKSTLDPRD